jgi:hypothetical protein
MDPISALKAAVLTALLAPLQNISASFAAIEASPTEETILTEFAKIKGQEVTLVLELPALVPTLEGDAIALAAKDAQGGLANLISAIQGQITPPAAKSAEETKTEA